MLRTTMKPPIRGQRITLKNGHHYAPDADDIVHVLEEDVNDLRGRGYKPIEVMTDEGVAIGPWVDHEVLPERY